MIKRYENESYLTECETVVTSLEEREDGIFIRLEETIFFPEEGGQYADQGTLFFEDRKVQILDGIFRKGDVCYKVDAPIPVGTKVLGKLDWAGRFMRMQQHTGEHIMVGYIHNRFGFDNVGFHLSETAPVTLDVNGVLTGEQVREVEDYANEVVFRNLPVTALYPTKEELTNISFRSKMEIEGQVRLIRIGEGEDFVDLCACCAPHVKRTGEIGLIKVVDFQKYKGGTRIRILCGKRGLDYVREQQRVVNDLTHIFSAPAEQLATLATELKEELGAVKYQMAKEKEEQVLKEIEQMPATQNLCYVTELELSVSTLKNCFNIMADKAEAFAAVFVGNDESGYRFNAGSRRADSRELAKRMRSELGSKGGGSAEMIQGKVTVSKEELIRFFEQDLLNG